MQIRCFPRLRPASVSGHRSKPTNLCLEAMQRRVYVNGLRPAPFRCAWVRTCDRPHAGDISTAAIVRSRRPARFYIRPSMYRYDSIDRALVLERVAEYRDQVRRFLAGQLSEDEFRPLRLRNGLYLQRHAP